MAIPAAVGYGAMALGNALGNAFGPDQQGPPPTYSVPGIWEQGNLIQNRLRQMLAGGGDFGFGAAAGSANSTLQSMLGGSGFTGGVTAGGAGANYTSNMLAQALGMDAQNRRGYELGLAQATPWTFTYQNKGNSPYGTNWNGPQGGQPIGRMSPSMQQAFMARNNLTGNPDVA